MIYSGTNKVLRVFSGSTLCDTVYSGESIVHSEIEIVGSSSATFTGTATPTLDISGISTESGDLCIFEIAGGRGAGIVPSGFTTVVDTSSDSDGIFVGYKVLDGTETSIVSSADSDSDGVMIATIYRYASVKSSTSVSNFTADPSSATATMSDVVHVSVGSLNNLGPSSPPSGYTENTDIQSGVSSGCFFSSAYKIVDASGIEDPGVFTITGLSGTVSVRVQTIVLERNT